MRAHGIRNVDFKFPDTVSTVQKPSAYFPIEEKEGWNPPNPPRVKYFRAKDK